MLSNIDQLEIGDSVRRKDGNSQATIIDIDKEKGAILIKDHFWKGWIKFSTFEKKWELIDRSNL